MNYITELNGFERWLENNYLPPMSQLLWYKLVGLFNRCGWPEWVTVDNQRLMSLIQLKREATFIELRNKLIEAGLIEYRKGKKGSPNQYKINTFNLKAQTEVQSVVQTEVKTVVETADINKLNENIYFSLLEKTRAKYPKPRSANEHIIACGYARRQPEWEQLTREEQFKFMSEV